MLAELLEFNEAHSLEHAHFAQLFSKRLEQFGVFMDGIIIAMLLKTMNINYQGRYTNTHKRKRRYPDLKKLLWERSEIGHVI